MQDIVIQPIDAQYLDQAVALGVKFVEAAPFFGKPSPEKLRAVFSRDDVFSVIAIDGDMVVGVMLGGCFDSFFSDEKKAADLGCYIDDAYRSRGLAKVFFNSFEQWAKDVGAKVIWVGQSTGHTNTEKLCEMYKGMGYSIRGVTAAKEI